MSNKFGQKRAASLQSNRFLGNSELLVALRFCTNQPRNAEAVYFEI